jgi:8-oxo-dGTP diphosphatase
MPEFTYPYARPALTADLVVVRPGRDGDEVLLIQRKHAPCQYRWALPGGYVNAGETALAAARRETHEEAGVTEAEDVQLFPVGFYDDPDRDPRGWVVSAAFACRVPEGTQATAADDAQRVQWADVRDLPLILAFDHKRILQDAFTLPALAVDLRDRKTDPQVGDGVTMGVGSDRYPYEVVAVHRAGKEIVVGSCDTHSEGLELLPPGGRSEHVLTLRCNGRWVTRGQAHDDCTRWAIGHKDYHRDPHF